MPASSATVSKVYTKEQLCLMEVAPESCGIVIFGASGDLSHRKLLPALFDLLVQKLMPPHWYVVGVGRTSFSDDAFRATVEPSLGKVGTPESRRDFASHCHYLSGDYDDPKTYQGLVSRLQTLDQQYGIPGRRIFHLATPPPLYETIGQQLGQAGLGLTKEKDGWARIIIEKPFGYDLDSAQALNDALFKVFNEDQIYRIDHYLGKDSVQNLLMFRFANAIYEPLWNSNYIDHIQITAAETVGVEHRAGYYEQAGALRDMVQNHLLQLLSLVTMEPPSSFDSTALRNETAKALASLQPLNPEDFSKSVVRAQYSSGTVSGNKAAGYRQEPGVKPESTTETYAALRVEMDNWRWKGVPFYLRTGKQLPERLTDITVQFKHVPSSIFKPILADQLTANILNFRIQPKEGITLRFEAKHPGPKLCMSTVSMGFDYHDAFGTEPPEAYTRLFLDVMLGDQTLFARKDWLCNSWGYLTPILNYWREQKGQGLCFYPAGTWGPAEADTLLARENRTWLAL